MNELYCIQLYNMKNKTIYLFIGFIIILLIGVSLWSKSVQSKDSSLISTKGIHWHPELVIYVKDQKYEIPQNIGIGTIHQPIHTHADLPIIHLEFSGVVKKEDILLGKFFKNWAKDMRSFGTNMKMTVNGVDNTEFENYSMKDGDKIELRYN